MLLLAEVFLKSEAVGQKLSRLSYWEDSGYKEKSFTSECYQYVPVSNAGCSFDNIIYMYSFPQSDKGNTVGGDRLHHGCVGLRSWLTKDTSLKQN